jgi:uncharacterized membrane protein YheB (UPF0754 family)
MTIYLLPFIAAFIGWFTNWIAIKMLFHPKEPVRFLGLTIQGIFPKRQAQFAASLGSLVSRELITFDDIARRIHSPETLQKVLPVVEEKVHQYIHVKLKEEMPLLSMFINEKTMSSIQAGIVKEFEAMFPVMLDKLTTGMQQELNVERLVTDKVAAFSSDKLEAILFSIMSREFRFVEIVGAVLGFLIGWIQILLTLL